MSSNLDGEISDYLIQFLLRYFRNATSVDVERPNIDIEQDLEFLRLHWAISNPVRNLVAHLQENPHEIAAILETQSCIHDAHVRGHFDARETVIRQLITGHPVLMVCNEPLHSYNSGPNHVLIWVLEQAWRLVQHFQDILPEGASYLEAVKACVPGLEVARRFEAVHQATKQLNLTRRPGHQAVRESNRSRRPIYVLACEAYQTLQAIETGNLESITELLNDTLLGPLKSWQRFELAVGLSMARALSTVSSLPMSLGFFGSDEPISSIGVYDVYWQSRTSAWRGRVLEPTEEIVSDLLRQYGLPEGAERPDLVVLDRYTNNLMAIAEVKYYLSQVDSDADALRQATDQLVCYTRGYRNLQEIDGLLDHSIVALARMTGNRNPEPRPFGLPLVVDFAGIIQGQMEGWAHRLMRDHSADTHVQLSA